MSRMDWEIILDKFLQNCLCSEADEAEIWIYAYTYAYLFILILTLGAPPLPPNP